MCHSRSDSVVWRTPRDDAGRIPHSPFPDFGEFITGKSLQKWNASAIANSFLCRVDAAKSKQGVTTRFVRRHSRAQIVLNLNLKIRLEFFPEIPFDISLSEQIREALKHGRQHRRSPSLYLLLEYHTRAPTPIGRQ